MKNKHPLVSIISVNYNGQKFLSECFSSVFKIDFPKSKYEVIMVDNGSKDLSVKFTKENFPDVRIIESQDNLGFAGGCNLGVKESKGKYVVLLNNDTRVERNWLSALVKKIQSDKNIGAVNSKLLLYHPFVGLTINTDIFMRSEFTNTINFQPVGVQLENVVLENLNLQHLVRYRDGFYNVEKGMILARWTKGTANILIPCDPNTEKTNLVLTIRSGKTFSNLQTRISASLGSKILLSDTLGPSEIKQYPISIIYKEVKHSLKYEVQNSGVTLFKNGYGRDRGAVVTSDRTQFYEIDSPFYGQVCQINSFCGASVIIRKDIFNKLGGFDESFFMYYEDVDLSLRMKRMGWKIIYEPKSVVFHIHAASSGEWSRLFTYNVEKNHLAVLVKHFPYSVIFKEFLLYLIMWMITVLKMGKWRLKEHWELFEELRERVECRSAVIAWILKNFYLLFKERLLIMDKQKKSMQNIYKELY